MPKKTIGLIVSLFIITVILLVAALRTKPSTPITVPEQNTDQPVVASVAQSELTLSPNPVSLSSTGSGSVDVMIDTKENEVTAVQLELQYDPKAISNVKVTTDTFFEDPVVLINTNDQKAGRATYALGISPAQSPTKGTGIVAKITFTKTTRTTIQETDLQLLPTSLVTSSGVDESVLKSAMGTKIMISN